MQKLDAMRKLKFHNTPFVKFGAGNIPLHTSYNPTVFACLWPTLFPYGVEAFEDDILYILMKLLALDIDMKPHVSHLLSLSEPRFQKHISFIFVMINIIRRKTSSFQSKLAFKRSWFPQVSKALARINEEALKSMQSKLIKNPNAVPENDAETAASELLKYVNYMSDHVSGFTAEINAMHEGIRAIIRSQGLPHVFVTINPADAHNPVAWFMAGRDISLDTFFDTLSSDTETFEQANC